MKKKIVLLLCMFTFAFSVFAANSDIDAVPKSESEGEVKVNAESKATKETQSETDSESGTELQKTARPKVTLVTVDASSEKREQEVNENVSSTPEVDDVTLRKVPPTTTRTREIYASDPKTIRGSKPVSAVWSIGVDFYVPAVKKMVSNFQKDMGLGPSVSIGMLIKNVGYLGLNATPMFISGKQQETEATTKNVPLHYAYTSLELNVGARFDWGDTDTFFGFAAGVEADNFKNFYIMPNVRFGLSKLGILSPAFESINILVGGKYDISTKFWDIKIGLSIQGIY